MLNTPVIFLIFRRPDLTAQVFEQIRLAQPAKLFVVADGPRNEEEKQLCDQARQIIETIDWECEVYKNYSDVNLGCRERVSSGITWAFEQVEEAIILEDDCLPHPSFFRFCEELLDYYRDDERIWCISGDNFQDKQWRGDGSYYFSNYPHCWGWATWSRAWKYYDKNLAAWETCLKNRKLKGIFRYNDEVTYWENILNKLYLSGEPSSWAYVWGFTCWQNSGISILPNLNLVANIGCDSQGTHIKKESDLSCLPTEKIQNINHPSCIVRDLDADRYTFRKCFLPEPNHNIFAKVKNKFKQFIEVSKVN